MSPNFSMKPQQLIGSSLPAAKGSPHTTSQNWRPVHPFLRFVSAVLSVVLAISGNGTVSFAEIIVETPESTFEIPRYSVRLNQVAVPTETVVGFDKFSAIFKGNQSATTVVTSEDPLGSVMNDPERPFLITADTTLHLELAGIKFGETSDPDKAANLEGSVGRFDAVNIGTLTLFGKIDTYEKVKNSGKWFQTQGTSVLGLQIPIPEMVVLMGTHDGSTGKMTKIQVAADQDWKIDQATFAGAVVDVTQFDPDADSPLAYVAARVENGGELVSLGINMLNGEQAGQAGRPSIAWLDVGSGVQIFLNQGSTPLSEGRTLVLALGAPVNVTDRKAFDESVTFYGGILSLGPNFLSVGSNGTAPSIVLPEEANTNEKVLLVTGLNTVSDLTSSTYANLSIRASTMFDIISKGQVIGGTLAFQVGSGTLDLGALLTNGENLEPLTILKRGPGSIRLLNQDNDFGAPESSGLRLEEGTLIVGTWNIAAPDEAIFSLDNGKTFQKGTTPLAGAGTISMTAPPGGSLVLGETSRVSGLGTGNLYVASGTSTVTIRVPASATGFDENTVTLLGVVSGNPSVPKVLFEGQSVTDRARTTPFEIPVLQVLLENSPSDAATFELENSIDLKVSKPEVSGTLIKSGSAKIVFTGGITGNAALGTLVLREGTVTLDDQKFLNSRLAISGSAGASRTVSLTQNTVVESGSSGFATEQRWSAGFKFIGDQYTLDFRQDDNRAAAVYVQDSVPLEISSGTLSVGDLLRAPGSGVAALSKSGDGTLLFAGDNISSGSLELGGMSFLAGTVRFSGGSLGASMSLSSPLVVGTSNGNLFLQVDANRSVSVSGTVSGTGFTKTGTGALAFTRANTISGTTTLRSGALSLASGTGAIFVGDAQTLDSGAPTLFSTGTVSGPITIGSGTTSAYTATLASSGTTGTATFSGPIIFPSTSSASLFLQAATGGTLDLTGGWSATTKPVTVGEPGNSGKAGTVKLSKTLSTTGTVSVVSGSLQLGASDALGANTPVTLNGGMLALGTGSFTAGAVTMTSGSIYGAGSLNAASVTAQSGSIFANLAGAGSFTKKTTGSVTVVGKSLYSGATLVSEGSLTSGLPVNSAITVEPGGTYTLSLSASGDYNSTILNNGVIRLTGASSTTPVVLTINQAGALSGSIEVVGNNVTLRAKDGVNNIFSSDFKLTLNGGKFDANGTTQEIHTISIVNGGSLISLGNPGTINTTSAILESSYSNLTIVRPVVRDVVINGSTLEFYSGPLGDLASGGSYSQIVTQAKKQGETLVFDNPVRGSISVTARVSSGTFYTLSVGSLVTTPLFDIQSGVTAVFTQAGSLSSGGTLQIGGTVDLSGNTKAFSSIRLTDGRLTKGTLSGGSVEVTGTGASSLSATLGSDFGNITKNAQGTLTIAGASPDYKRSLFVNAGTVTLGTVSALGGAANIGILAQGATLQMAGNHLEVASISGAGILENAAVQAATLTFSPKADSVFNGVLRNGTAGGTPTGVLSVVKDGSATLTLGATLQYSGGTTVKQGSLVLSDVTLPSTTALNIEGGVLVLGGQPQTVASYSQSGGSLQGGALSLTAGSYQLRRGSISAVLAGTAAALVEGDVTLNAAATYTGGTTVKAGTLSLGVNGSLWGTSDLTVQQGGTFSLGGKDQALGSYTQTGGRVENGTITAGAFSLNGGVVDARLGGSAAATVDGIVTLNQTATYTGGTTVKSGSLILGADGALLNTAQVVVQTGGTFSLGGKERALGSYTQTGGRVENGTIKATSFSLSGGLVNAVLAGTGAGATVEGDVTLNRFATYTGGTTVKSGKLTLGDEGMLPIAAPLNIEGGTFNLAGKTQVVGAFTINGGLVEAGNLAATGYTLAGGSIRAVLEGTAAVGVSGNVTLFAANTVTGDTTITSGTLTIADEAALSRSAVVYTGGSLRFASGISATTFAGLSGTQALALSNEAGKAVALTLRLSGPQTYRGVLSGNGGLTLSGGGSLTLTAPSTFTGETTINAGLLSAGTSLVSTSAINLNAGTFEATSYNTAAALKIAAPGTARITGGTVSLGNITNAGNLSFTNPEGDITIGSLSGNGTTNFAASGTINSVLSGGILNVAGDLVVNSTISGGAIFASTANIDTVIGGSLRVSGSAVIREVAEGTLELKDNAAITSISGGTLLFSGTSSSITLGMVSAGSLTLNAAKTEIELLKGGSLANSGELTIKSGNSAGLISGNGALIKQGSQALTLNGNLNGYTGQTNVLGGTLFIGENTSLSKSAGLTVAGLAETRFASGAVELKALSGTGRTFFAGDATVKSTVEQGTLSAAGRFTVGVLGGSNGTGPLLEAKVLDIGTMNGGFATGQAGSRLENLAGGSLRLAGGQSEITRLTGGVSTSLTLEGPAQVQVSSGNYLGVINGAGSLVKVGSASLDLATAPAGSVNVAVQGGSLFSVGNLLTGDREVSVATGATLSLSNVTGTSVFSGTLSGSGTTALSGTGLTLERGASLDGALNLKGNNFKLDISNAGTNPFGGSATLAFGDSGVFVLGANQEVELNALILGLSPKLEIQTTGAGARILYDPSNRPVFLGQEEVVVLSAGGAALNGVSVTGGSVTFDVLSQGTFTSSGAYQATAGRVLLRGGSFVSAPTLLLEPKTAETDLRLAGGIFEKEIIAGGSLAQGRGSVSLDGAVTAGSLTINSGVRFNFNGAGALSNGTGGATPITNRGTLAFTVESGPAKTVANVLSGSGSTEKLGAGALELKGANTAYTGAFSLRAGTLVLGNENALGSGSLSFNGGVLKYGNGVTSDLSGQIGTLGSGVTALVDIGTSNVSYRNSIDGRGSFEKKGTGILAFTNGANFEGNLGVKEGVVKIDGGVLKAQTAEVVSGATLRFASSNALGYAGTLSGAGTVEQAGTGVLTLSGLNAGFGGKVGLKSGVLEFGSEQAIGAASLAFQGGTLRVGGSVTAPRIDSIDQLAATDVARIETTSEVVVMNAALRGDGRLVKTGDGTLKLLDATNYTGSTNVLKGTLEAANLLTGNREVSVATGATLSLSNVTGTSVFSGTLSGSGTTALSGTGLTLERGASLDGALNLKGNNFKLDISNAGTNPFGGSATLAFGDSGVFVLGANQEVALNGLTSGGSTNILEIQTTGVGSKILYDPSNRPNFLREVEGEVVVLSAASAALNGVRVTGGSVTFDVLSQGTFLLTGSTYQATAGRVQQRGGSPITAATLLLEPKTAETDLRLAGGVFEKEIIAGGSLAQGRGSVSLDGAVTAGSLTINSGVRFNFNGEGSLSNGTGGATPITNRGTLAFTVESGPAKTVANVLSGSGSTEKLGAGALELKGANTAYTGAFSLRAGTLVLGNENALGSGSLSFNGGALKYGNGVTSDLSGQIGTLGSFVTALVDIGTSNVSYRNSIDGRGSFEKKGTGILAFTNGANFEGNLGVKEGVVKIDGGVLKAQTAEVVSGAALRFASSNTLGYTGTLSGAGTVEQAGTGVLTLSGANTGFDGNVNLKSGVLRIGGANALGTGTLAFQGGVLQVAAGVPNPLIASVARLSQNDTARIDTNSQDFVLNAALEGEGGLLKTGEGLLTLGGALSYTGETSVVTGTLKAANLLTAKRSVKVSQGATLSLSEVNGTYSGALSGTGRTEMTGTNLTLGNGASLDGAIMLLGDTFVLDLSGAGKNPFGANAALEFGGENQLRVAGGQELELNALTFSDGARLNIQVGAGGGAAKIYYDTTPEFLKTLPDTVTFVDGQTRGDVSVSGGSVTFEVLSQGTFTSSGTYQATAGRVQVRGGSLGAPDTLLLDPKTAETIVRLNGGSFSKGIIAGGSANQGTVLVGGTVQTSEVVIKSGVLMRLAQAGVFEGNPGGAQPVFVNAGTLQFSVEESASKEVRNVMTGSGNVEKVDSGTLILRGRNDYSGRTTLMDGVLRLEHDSAVGTTGPISFRGGALEYGPGVTVDLSKRIEEITGDAAIVDVGTNTVTYSAPLSGDGGLTKAGSGVLVLAAAETFKGSLSVAAGTVQVGSGTLGSLQAGEISVATGAMVRFQRSGEAIYSGKISGSGRFEQAGSGTLTLEGDGSEFTGSYVLSNGVLLLGGQNSLSAGSISFENGALKYGSDSSAALDLSSRINPVGPGFVAAIDTGSFSVAYANSLTGEGSLKKSGSGMLTFTEGAANLLQGPTTVVAGTLQYVGNAALKAGGTINTLVGGNVQLTSLSTDTFSGSVQGAGSLIKAGSGTVLLSHAQAVSGGVNIQEGTLSLSTGASLQGRIQIAQGATLNIANGILDPSSALSIAGNLVVGNGTTFLKSVALSGAGVAVLDPTAATEDGAFLFTEDAVVGALPDGPVKIRQVQKNGNSVVVGGSLSGRLSGLPEGAGLNLERNSAGNKVTLTKSGTLSSLRATTGVDLLVADNLLVNGDVSMEGVKLELASGKVFQSNAGEILFGGSSSATVQASGTLSATTVTVNSSTLTLLDSANVKASSFNINSGATVTVNDPASLSGVDVVSVGSGNSGRLIVNAGTFVLSGGQVLKGTGSIEGSVNVPRGAVLSPGNSPGTLTVGTLSFGAGGTLVLEHGQAAVDKLVTGSSLTLTNGAQILLVDYDRSLLAGTSGYAFSGTVATSGTVAVTVAVRLGNDTGLVGDDGVSYPVATSALYSGSLTSAGSLVVNRLSAAQVVGAAGNLEKVALSVESRLKALAKTPFAVTDFDRIGTGTTAADAKLNLAQQLAAINPAIYAEMAALSTQRTLNIHQGLVGHFSSLRANLREIPDGGLNAWTTGYGAGHRQDGNRGLGTAGFSASTWGDMLGVEQRIGGFLLGVTGAAGRTSANFANNPGSVTTDSFHGGLYGVLDLEELLIESGVMFGGTDSRVRRTVSAPGLTSRQGTTTLTGMEWVANLGISMPTNVSPRLTITPSVRVIAQGQSQNAANESDLSGLEMSLAKQKTTTIQHQAGVEARRKFILAGRPAAASLQLDWIHNYNAKGRSLDMAFSGDPSASFGYRGSDSGADAIHIGTAVEASLSERVTLRLGGEYQSQTSLSTVRGSVSIGYQF
jgi:fibronectin-binding autotransporter adhesin